MSEPLGIIAIAAVTAGLGARLGGRRLAALVVGMIAGAAIAPWLGPVLAKALANATGWNAWAGDAACWAAVYVGIAYLASALFSRSGDVAAPRRFHPSGAVIGGVAGGLIGWIALGNFAGVVLDHLPTDTAAESGSALRRPLEILRACRVLRSLSGDEAERLAGHPHVQAVVNDESFAALLRTPGLVRRFSRAAEGDWIALGSLAADPSLKAAMSEPEFLRRVRAVDVVALAADVERRRDGLTAADESPAELRLPPIVADVEVRNRLAAEWLADQQEPPEVDADAYWRNVGVVLDVFDRPTGAGWLPRMAPTLLPDIIRDSDR